MEQGPAVSSTPITQGPVAAVPDLMQASSSKARASIRGNIQKVGSIYEMFLTGVTPVI